ncbi:MAG: pyrroline-5-carboxylate reductase [Pseudomonadales bacterium]|jgi:pyrroline-5-carboxylate reductase|nr:pyrroline-5-carboxylate reductase [Pseudomonadales bacterium]
MLNSQLTNSQLTIGFIGAGNMATALIEGLIRTGVAPGQLHASDHNAEHLSPLAARGLRTSANNATVAAACDVVMLAVKPQVLGGVLREVREALCVRPRLLLSIAAGIQIHSLQAWTHPEQAIVRCMPNTPALVQAGASGLYANAAVSDAQKQQATAILQAVGIVCWLEHEAQLDAVTALSGSGPAYFFLMMEAMEQAAIALGLSAEVARPLCLQTAFGAAKLAIESAVEPGELRRRVTSPGGTTAAALAQFEQGGYQELVARALQAAASRAAELAAVN